MAETRDCQIMVNIEPTFMALVRRVQDLLSMSASSYVRRLIIRDLQDRGLLTVDSLVSATTISDTEISALLGQLK